MPTLALHYCGAPGCNALVSTAYCAEHAIAQEHARTNFDLRRLYRTARWRRLRAQVLSEEALCRECMEEDVLITPSVDVHHVLKATSENFFDRENLQALCKRHHSQHTQRGE